MTPRVLDRLSIAARLQLLSVSLILVIAGSNLYLTRALQQAAAKALYADRTVSQIEIVQGVRAAFDSLRYWRADLAVSLLMLSERNALEARHYHAPLRHNQPPFRRKVSPAKMAGFAAFPSF